MGDIRDGDGDGGPATIAYPCINTLRDQVMDGGHDVDMCK